MFQSLMITLREGLEAFLIVAISLAYLRKTGRDHLVTAVYAGIAVSVVVSVFAGWLFSKADNQALWEGVLAMVAGILVASLTVHMWRAGRKLRGQIQDRLEESASRSTGAWLGVFAFIVLMISREGMETALLFSAILFQVKSSELLVGAVLGILAAAGLAWMWARWGHRLNLGVFLQVTAVFLLLFVVQLLIYGFHELTEANLFPYSEELHWATEPYGPDGRYGRYLSYLLVLLPAGWLLWAALRGRLAVPPANRTV